MESATATVSSPSVTVNTHLLERLREEASSGSVSRPEALYWARLASRVGLRLFDLGEMGEAQEMFQFSSDFIRYSIR